MRDMQYYVSQPKIDAHNHLNLGMHYNTYLAWSGVPITDFPRAMKGLDDMHDIISRYTRPRCQTADDVKSLIDMSIKDAIADGVTVLEGSIDIGFMVHFKENIDKFLQMVSAFVSKYENQIEMRPELGLGKTFDKKKIAHWAPAMLDSKIFKSIDLYGPEILEGIGDFKYLFDQASKLGLKKKAHAGEFSDAASVQYFVEFFELHQIQHGIGAAADDRVLRFLADNRIQCNVCPQSNVMLGAVKSLKDHPIKKMMDAGVPVTVATDDLLFFGHTVSRQIFNLVNEKVITEADGEKLLATGL
jgi:adenosine deaminase